MNEIIDCIGNALLNDVASIHPIPSSGVTRRTERGRPGAT